MTDEDNTNTVAESATGEKRYPDPHGLYRWWLDALEEGSDETSEGEVSSAELGGLWRRWFGATTGLQTGAPEAENELANGMASLWKEMADEFSAEMLSGESLPEDPAKFFVQWYNANKDRWSEAADELLRSDEVLESMGRFLETCARSETESRRVSEEGLKRLRVPTRSDVARVAKLVVVVENKVDRIEETLEELVQDDFTPAAAGALSSLEERMDRLESKMDRVLAALEKLGSDDREGLPRTPQSLGARKENADEPITPLEGLSLELIEAGYAGAGRWSVVEGPRTKDED